MSSSERSFFLLVTVIAATNLLTLALAVARFFRTAAESDLINWFPFLGLLIAILYAWIRPIGLLQDLDEAEPDLRNRMSRGIYQLSLSALLAVQIGLMLWHVPR